MRFRQHAERLGKLADQMLQPSADQGMAIARVRATFAAVGGSYLQLIAVRKDMEPRSVGPWLTCLRRPNLNIIGAKCPAIDIGYATRIEDGVRRDGWTFDGFCQLVAILHAELEPHAFGGPVDGDGETFRNRHIFYEALTGDLADRFGERSPVGALPKLAVRFGDGGIMDLPVDLFHEDSARSRWLAMTELAEFGRRVLNWLADELEADVTPGDGPYFRGSTLAPVAAIGGGARLGRFGRDYVFGLLRNAVAADIPDVALDALLGVLLFEGLLVVRDGDDLEIASAPGALRRYPDDALRALLSMVSARTFRSEPFDGSWLAPVLRGTGPGGAGTPPSGGSVARPDPQAELRLLREQRARRLWESTEVTEKLPLGVRDDFRRVAAFVVAELDRSILRLEGLAGRESEHRRPTGGCDDAVTNRRPPVDPSSSHDLADDGLVPPAVETRLIEVVDDRKEAAPRPNGHSADFSFVHWDGNKYLFTKQQARVVEVLWEEWERSGGGLSEESIGERVRSDYVGRFRLRDVFRSKGAEHEAWGPMIAKLRKGIFGLCARNTQKKPR